MRVAFMFLVCLLGVLGIMPSYIKFLKKINYNQVVCEYSLEEYQNKAKTPTMGGVLFVVIPLIAIFIFGENIFQDINALLVVFAFFGFGVIGFIDDFIIVIKQDNEGLKPMYKIILQLLISIIFYYFASQINDSLLYIPLFKVNLDLGFMYSLFIFFMFVAETNAVNITDGMDGLAAGLVFIALVPFLILAFLQHQTNIVIFIIGVMAALIGYLKFNKHPAKIFMGDAGSLALGGLLAALAMVLGKEIALIFIGGVFFIEALCVVIQIGSVKIRHKRVFKYTPIHYSFVLDGMREVTVVKHFYVAGIVCAVIGLIVGIL